MGSCFPFLLLGNVNSGLKWSHSDERPRGSSTNLMEWESNWTRQNRVGLHQCNLIRNLLPFNFNFCLLHWRKHRSTWNEHGCRILIVISWFTRRHSPINHIANLLQSCLLGSAVLTFERVLGKDPHKCVNSELVLNVKPRLLNNTSNVTGV